jgi:hypothetical protein
MSAGGEFRPCIAYADHRPAIENIGWQALIFHPTGFDKMWALAQSTADTLLIKEAFDCKIGKPFKRLAHRRLGFCHAF